MERVKKYICSILVFSLLLCLQACAEENTQVSVQTPTSTVSAPQNVNFSNCIRTFGVNYEKLFLLTEAAIASNNFQVEELQTQGGYIVFSVAQYKFLATVMAFGNKAILKITPCNNNYTFPPVIVRNIFKYIESNQYKKF